jgi:predicted glycosyltransferase
MEQYIRVSQAQELGLVRMLEDDGRLDAEVMTKALCELPYQNQPSDVVVPGLLEGLDNVSRLVEPWVTDPMSAKSGRPPSGSARAGRRWARQV